MKTFEELEIEALESFNKQLKTKTHIYDVSDRLGFVLGYVGAEYEQLRTKLLRYEKKN